AFLCPRFGSAPERIEGGVGASRHSERCLEVGQLHQLFQLVCAAPSKELWFVKYDPRLAHVPQDPRFHPTFNCNTCHVVSTCPAPAVKECLGVFEPQSGQLLPSCPIHRPVLQRPSYPLSYLAQPRLPTANCAFLICRKAPLEPGHGPEPPFEQ